MKTTNSKPNASKSAKNRTADETAVFSSKNDVRVAAVLGKTSAARCLYPADIAKDAIALSRYGLRARSATRAQKTLNKLVAEAQAIADRYHAIVVSEPESSNIILGLRFLDGSFADIGRGIFRIS
ncbi:hypothetical protein [Hyphomicrobium sp. MC1]|uniref:hypothetical protein n=1 Tax=Hyphomicrobium sp. (strain MC1) TaxID=717785 RepID=UPI00059E64D9|nr:hypothetical protein [Hyphomicrobium sp. MC1]